MLQISANEFVNLRRQLCTSSQQGGWRYPPYAFTQQGVAVLSSVLRSGKRVAQQVARTCFARSALAYAPPPGGFSILHSIFPIPRPSVLMHDSRNVNLAFLYLV